MSVETLHAPSSQSGVRSSRKIPFVVATNFDPELPSLFADLNRAHRNAEITEIYGAMPKTAVGHGRSAWGLPQVGLAEVREHVQAAHDNGLSFNYLLNGTCTDKQRDDPGWVASVIKEVTELVSIGVDLVTVADEWLIRLLTSQFPNLPIRLSLIAGVDTPDRARFYEDLGVVGMTLNAHTVNRDFDTIRRIVEAVEIPVQLFANVSCLDHCPWRDDHYAFVTNQSRLKVLDSGRKGYDPFISKCLHVYQTEPVELLKTPFIRPHDVPYYSSLGVESFKLTDRKLPTGILRMVADCYLHLQDPPDLFPLIFGKVAEWLDETNGKVAEDALPSIRSTALTNLDFIHSVEKLRGARLREFYELATGLALEKGGSFSSFSESELALGKPQETVETLQARGRSRC